MPLTELQVAVLSTLAASRNPESHIAGGVALNREGPRYSADVDIFHDRDEIIEATVATDIAALTTAGFEVEPVSGVGLAKRGVLVRQGTAATRIEWVADSDFRFFPAVPDPLFGYVLHPVDLATNKAAAAADRRTPRDIIDLLTIDAKILPLGAVVSAAVGRFPGLSPEGLLAEITRHSRFTAPEFEALSMAEPLDPPDIHRRVRAMLERAEAYLADLPSEAVGFVLIDEGRPVAPTPDRLPFCIKHAGARRGHWPGSSEIGSAMLDRLIGKA